MTNSNARRTKLLSGILLVCFFAAAFYYKFREPPVAPEEPPQRVVQIPIELLETPAEYLDVDVDALNTVRSDADVADKRAALVTFLWGEAELPQSAPADVAKAIADERYADIEALDSIDKLTVRMDYGLESHIYHFQPKTPNDAVVLYHQGHRGDFHLSKAQIAQFLESGYAVVAFAMPLLGLNNQPVVPLERFGNLKLIDHDNMKFLTPDAGHPLQYFVEPVVAAINYLASEHSYAAISMAGISGGGWTTTIVAAIDTRIGKSFSVAGSYPLYLRSNSRRDWGDYEQTVPELYRIANYLELYTLGSVGEGRSQLQVYNQLDSCCFGGTKWETYAPSVAGRVAELGSGEFRVFLDDTHMDHALSGVAMEQILAELSR